MRRLMTRELLRDVAKVYRDACEVGKPPTVAVAEHFHASHSTATRWVTQARKAGELGPARGTKAGELNRPSGPRVGTMLAVDGDHSVAWKLPCLSADMAYPGWMRIVLEPDSATGESTVTWWRVPDEVRLVEWQPGGTA